MEPLALGMDIGGTASRAVVATLGGDLAGEGRAGPGNPLSAPLEQAVAAVAQAAREALGRADPVRVQAAVLGLAGVSECSNPETDAAFRRALESIGLRCEARMVGDAVIAFAAGTDSPNGTVLIAGTGAAAATVAGEELTRVSDGLGWLLGDRGSGFWIGRRAAALTASSLQEAAGPSRLAETVAEAVTGAPHPTADDFARAVYRRPHRDLARLAALVDRAAETGDELAASILAEAADHLAATVARVRGADETDPIVLAGGVLLRSRQVREGVSARLATAWPNAAINVAGPAAPAAARLAAARARLR
ncbi:N-acetylglucosamine kinase [Glycomyces salinus]|uniref:N-acetylglucosamine kinase n=1 Tax=Glycomyces salinus TaxID=980294 RepID=UPI0018ECD7FC|nr:BadF/BadG/BcrA/BcrD ATPase family protein [Glycomyces salinus]